MWGAIAGDLIGSPYESGWLKSTEFPLFSPDSRFTNDSVLTVATAEVLLDGGDYFEAYQRYFRMYPNAGFGSAFYEWAAAGRTEPYGSFGNGSAMRVSPIGMVFDTLEEVVQEAKRSAEVSHNHPEGIKGARAVAAAVFMARNGSDKPLIQRFITDEFGYEVGIPLHD